MVIALAFYFDESILNSPQKLTLFEKIEKLGAVGPLKPRSFILLWVEHRLGWPLYVDIMLMFKALIFST